MTGIERPAADAAGPGDQESQRTTSDAPDQPVAPLDASLVDLMSEPEDHVTFNLLDANAPAAGLPGLDPSDITADGITLSVDDVLLIGTESIGGIEALMVTGDQGDVVRLRSDSSHNWEPAAIEAPSGFAAYHAMVSPEHDITANHHQAPHDIYVLVQQDLQVILNYDQG